MYTANPSACAASTFFRPSSMKSVCAGTMPLSAITMRKLDGQYDVTDAEIAGAYGAFLVEVPVGKLRQIERLRRAGIRTYVLSNNNPASMEVIRGEFTADGHTMDDYFDKIYLSSELRELNPSEAFFR